MVEEAGLETDGMAETTAKLQEKIKALSHGKVDIMIDANNFKSTTQILREMSDAYDEMTDVERAAALELLGGKRQANILSAILENFDIVEDAIEKSENSAGSALQENEKVLDSIQGRINQFNNALQTFWNHLLDSDVIKFFITLGTKIIQLASAFGEVRTVIFALLMYLNMSKKYPFDLASWIFGPKGIKNILGGLKKVGNYLDGLTKKKSAPLSLPAPGLPQPKDSIGSTTPPHNPTDGYARLGAGPEPIDFDKVYGSKFSRMWKNHVSRLRDSANRVKQDFIDIWQHHNERVGQSVQYASGQFNKLKTSASNAFGAVSKMVGKMANSLRNSFSNIFASMGRTKVATQSQNVIPYIGDEQKTTKQVNRFSQIWQHHMARLKDSIGRVKNDITTIWDHHNERVAQSAQYASAQFNKMKSSVTNTMHKVSQTISSATNKIRNSFVKATSKGTWYEDETGKVRRAKVMPSNLPANKQSAGENPSVAKRVAAEIGRIWKVHIANLKHNYQSLKGTFTTIWGHHKERVSASIKHTSAQFDAFKQKITNIQIPQWAKYAASGFKNFFSGAISFVQEKFGKLGQAVGNIFNKIKTTASATANAFKEKLGYNNQPKNAKSSTPMSWMDVSLSKTQLSVSDGDAAKIDLINTKLKEGQQSFNDYMSGANNASDALKAYYASLNGAQGSISGFNTFLKNHNAGLKASGVAAKVAAVGHMALNAALSMGLSVIISAGISAITSWINKQKELAEAVEETMAAYNNATKTLKDHYDTIEEIRDDYEELSDGVDDLGRNISLSTDEYQRYNEITNKIADMFPEMVSGYTDEGNAIIALKGNVDALTEAYKKEEEAARNAIIIASNDTFKNFRNNTTKEGFWSGLNKTDELSFFTDLISGKSFANDASMNKWRSEGSVYITNWLKNAGVDIDTFASDKKIEEAIQKHRQQIIAHYSKLSSELEAEVVPVRTTIFAYLDGNDNYQDLSDEGKKIARAIISGFDTEFYARDEFENWTDVAAWIDTNVIQKLQSTGNLEEFNIAFDLQTRFNNGKVKVDDYIEQINEFIKLLEQLGFDNEIITTIKGVFKIDDYETQKQSAMEILDAEGDKSAGTLTKDDLDIIDKNKTKWKKELELDGKAAMSWDELIKKIAEAKEMAWSASEEFDKISEAIDGIQDAYSTLSDVVTEYNENGFLSLDNLQALLSLEPEYLACLQMENGQLSINQQALQSMIQARLAEAKATVVQSAMDQLHTLAARTEEQAVTDSANAASNAVNGLGAYASALGTVAQDAIVAAGAVTAFNAAVEGAQNNKFVDQSEIDAIMSSMNTHLQMIDSVSANLQTNFNAITGLDKDDTGTGGSGKGDTALDRIKNKYEGKLSNLENQQTYIENEIEKLEAEDEAVSKSYYEQQISLEEKKIDLLKQERNELQALYKANPTQETADALWEIEHAIQESALRMVEFRQSIIDLYTTAFDKAITAYDNKDDFLSDQQNYIDKYRQLMEMNDSPLKASGYQEQLNAEWAKKNANISELALLEQIYVDAMANGLKEGSEEWVDLQDKIRATEEAILDNNIAIEEYAEAMRQIPVEAFNSVRDMFGYQTDFLTKQQDYIEGYADYLEAIGVDVPREVYDKLIEIERDKRANTLEDLVDARQGLKDIEAQGFTAADEEWQDAYNQITDLEKQIQDCDIAMAQWEKTIRDMDFEKFERFTNRLDDLNSEIEHIKNLLDDEDVAFTDGTWTEEGITSLGLLYQQMKLAEQKSKEYADKIEELNEAYHSEAMSEQEYYERLQELKEGQWGAIESYEDAKDAIVDMEEARIDMIEEGINEEIDAYKELIDLKKEELDAEKDLYGFEKNIQKQTKDIASLQRRIASMSGSTDASTIAERTKLQAQLREAQEGLDDTYYTHSMDAQSKALDDENEAYVKSKEDYLEMLRDTLDDTAAIINAKISEFLLNADVGLGELNGISQEHGITLSDALMQPWINASAISETFKQNADLNLFSLINEDGIVTVFGNTATDIFNDAFGAGGSAATLFTTTVNTKIAEIKFTVEQAKSPLTANLKYPWENTASADGPINTFSEKAKNAISSAVTKAQNNADAMKTFLSSPWTSAGGAVNTFASGVEAALDRAIKKAGEYANAVNNLPTPNPKIPDYTPTTPTTPPSDNPTPKKPLHSDIVKQVNKNGTSAVEQLQQILNQFFSAQLQVDGVYGPATKSAVANMQSWLSITPSGKYDQKTKDAMQKWLNQRNVSSWFRQVGFGIPAAMYAKGTMGTKRDEFAITDESWIGEEITLAAGKNGQLQYLKKGSAVLPSDIANNLVEWGKINPDMSAFSNGLQGMNVMTSVLNKPELNLEFGSLLHIDNCSNEVIPEVKKMVTEALDKFSRQLNYSLRRVGAK